MPDKILFAVALIVALIVVVAAVIGIVLIYSPAGQAGGEDQRVSRLDDGGSCHHPIGPSLIVVFGSMITVAGAYLIVVVAFRRQEIPWGLCVCGLCLVGFGWLVLYGWLPAADPCVFRPLA